MEPAENRGQSEGTIELTYKKDTRLHFVFLVVEKCEKQHLLISHICLTRYCFYNNATSRNTLETKHIVSSEWVKLLVACDCVLSITIFSPFID